MSAGTGPWERILAAIATQVSPAPTICVQACRAKISIPSQAKIIGQPVKATLGSMPVTSLLIFDF